MIVLILIILILVLLFSGTRFPDYRNPVGLIVAVLVIIVILMLLGVINTGSLST